VQEFYNRILIFNSAFPGDIVLTTPLIRAVYERFPGAYLAFCTTPAGVRLLAGLSYLDRLIVYDKHGSQRGLFGMLQTALRIRREQFDLVISAHRSARSALLLKMAGIGVRVGFQQSAWPWLYSVRVPRKREFHETERNLSLLAPFGVDMSKVSNRPVLPVTGEEANHVFGQLGVGLPRGSGPLVVVSPGSVWGTKRWIAERFAQLIDLLVEMYRARVIIVGSPLDREQADRLIAACKSRLLDLVGLTELRELCALVRKADLLVTGDSAPMHIAWAFDIPTVAIFGSTTPDLGFASLSGFCRVVEVKGLECRPCSDHGPKRCPLGHFHCMQGVTVDMVQAACKEMLELDRENHAYGAQKT
jgi:heptosyltransferase-2